MTTVERPAIILPVDWVPGPEQGSWTYDDYAALPDDGLCYEIVIGIFRGQQTLPSRIVPGLPVHVEQFFA